MEKNTKKYIGRCGINNTQGIGIIEIIYGVDDEVNIDLISDDEIIENLTCKIEYNTEGLPYFIIGEIDYYLSDFIRT